MSDEQKREETRVEPDLVSPDGFESLQEAYDDLLTALLPLAHPNYQAAPSGQDAREMARYARTVLERHDCEQRVVG